MLSRTAGVVVATCVLGCGSGGGGTPSSVSAADLQRDGKFWLRLSPTLKAELASSCKDRQVTGHTNPIAQSQIEKLTPDQFEAKIDSTYADASKQSEKLANACDAALVSLASEQFNQLIPQLQNGGSSSG